MTEPIEYATYDADDDKIRIYSGRVSEELYERLKELGYRRDWTLEKGGWVRGRGGWGQVVRVNKSGGQISSVSLDRNTFSKGWMPRIVKYPEIQEYLTNEEYQANLAEGLN